MKKPHKSTNSPCVSWISHGEICHKLFICNKIVFISSDSVAPFSNNLSDFIHQLLIFFEVFIFIIPCECVFGISVLYYINLKFSKFLKIFGHSTYHIFSWKYKHFNWIRITVVIFK